MRILVLLLLLAYATVLTCWGQDQPFVASIATRSRAPEIDFFPKYQFDYKARPLYWDDFPAELKEIADKAGQRPIVLDLLVHGWSDGLYLFDTDVVPGMVIQTSDRASMGWVLREIGDKLRGHEVTVLFESCFSGMAYHNTIRGAVKQGPYDNISDYPIVPTFPVWGAGSNFSVVGPIMYIQWKYNFRRWFVDLRQYDSLGPNKPVGVMEKEDPVTGLSKTTSEIQQVWHFFNTQIP